MKILVILITTLLSSISFAGGSRVGNGGGEGSKIDPIKDFPTFIALSENSDRGLSFQVSTVKADGRIQMQNIWVDSDEAAALTNNNPALRDALTQSAAANGAWVEFQ